MRRTLFWPAIPLIAIALLALSPSGARAEPPRENPRLQVEVSQQASLGDTVKIQAQLLTPAGEPIESARLSFLSPVQWNDEIEGDVEIGAAETDAAGIALFSYQMRRSGDIGIVARFDGDARFEPASGEAKLTVLGQNQLYLPKAGISVPGLGPWLIALVVAGVWGLYFSVGVRVLAIARTRALAPGVAADAVARPPHALNRRQFLTQAVVPVGMLTAITAVGSGLITVVVRAPYTHWNLARDPARQGYRRTPFVLVGQKREMMEMPALLDREVSFPREVLPLLLAKGGPHAYPPASSPPPAGVLLDTYEHIMAKEDLVVPGRPEDSTLMSVMMDRSMGMPPAGELFSMDEIQVIASWIAQGAKNG